MSASSRIAHHFTVDVEEYFHVSAFEGVVSRDRWESLPSRVERSTEDILELLARHGATGTFFTLGWVAERHPALVRRIAAAGHEVASHGHLHRRVTTLTRDEFREDVRRSRAVLEDVSGTPVVGFRAPSFSIVPGGEWAFDALLEEGYRYDSSLFPIRRRGYGWPGAPLVKHDLVRPAGTLAEFPLATTAIAGLRIPAAGGGYLRQFPFAIIQRAFREHDAAGTPGVFYIHPWEVDPGQPRMPVSALTRVRHYRNLHRTMALLERLLREFRFEPMAARLDRARHGDGGGAAAAHAGDSRR
jgi:polysaccharide deacetylase family protein (PEP-CTERM system associated)